MSYCRPEFAAILAQGRPRLGAGRSTFFPGTAERKNTLAEFTASLRSYRRESAGLGADEFAPHLSAALVALVGPPASPPLPGQSLLRPTRLRGIFVETR